MDRFAPQAAGQPSHGVLPKLTKAPDAMRNGPAAHFVAHTGAPHPVDAIQRAVRKCAARLAFRRWLAAWEEWW